MQVIPQCYSVMESIAIIAEQHNTRIQQVRTSPNAALVDTEMKEEKLLSFGRPPVGKDLKKYTLSSAANA